MKETIILSMAYSSIVISVLWVLATIVILVKLSTLQKEVWILYSKLTGNTLVLTGVTVIMMALIGVTDIDCYSMIAIIYIFVNTVYMVLNNFITNEKQY